MSNTSHKNRLSNSTSPYLLQHASNPVDWYPWGKEALNKAEELDKPILVSIGYSSCHWCHVMEKESFENDSIAAVMNDLFINIKVDREERPDIDGIYMDAVQAMGLGGGWPLNVFLTPDQKPFYGGTYFPPDTWVKLLKSISKAYSDKKEEIEKSANELAASLSTSELEKYGLELDTNPYDIASLNSVFDNFQGQFDSTHGGLQKAPKFPMPSNWGFLLRYAQLNNNKDAQSHALFTLDKMALGGIYDHVGGGFARYSTDAKWFAPHFEKMLYDNGQLLSLYSEGYMITKKDLYKNIVYETVEWLENEMKSAEGGYYSAIDADSQGEEGKFYVWQATELKKILGEEYDFYSSYYGVEENGNWEHKNNILFQTELNEKFGEPYKLKAYEVEEKISALNVKLLRERNKRIAPGIDTKIISGWNGMVIKGLTDAYNAFGDEKFLNLATETGTFIQSKMIDGNLKRSYKDGVANIDGYLEDYAFVIQGFLSLYEATFNEDWLTAALKLTDETITNFYDPKDNLFYFTSNEAESLIARKKEIFDNVIPSSNSQMAINLYLLGIISDNDDLKSKADKMLRSVISLLNQAPTSLSNWGILYSYMYKPTAEIVIVGKDMDTFRADFSKEFIPNKVIMGTKIESELPLFENRRAIDDGTTVYVCFDKTCKLPVTSVEEALKQLE